MQLEAQGYKEMVGNRPRMVRGKGWALKGCMQEGAVLVVVGVVIVVVVIVVLIEAHCRWQLILVT